MLIAFRLICMLYSSPWAQYRRGTWDGGLSHCSSVAECQPWLPTRVALKSRFSALIVLINCLWVLIAAWQAMKLAGRKELNR
jgi:hypothetical protein